MKIALIPARGGSKRIPRKNIKPFLGIPIIGRSILTALQSQVFDEIVVSTDDEEILETAVSFGAKAPFIRPVELADDYTDTFAVVRHAADWFEKNYQDVESICCIYATAPTMLASDLRVASEMVGSAGNGFVLPVCHYSFPVDRALIRSSGKLSPARPELITRRSQDLTEYFHDAGQFYFGLIKTWMAEGGILERENTPIPIPRHRVQDIDTLEDWDIAEKLYQLHNRTK